MLERNSKGNRKPVTRSFLMMERLKMKPEHTIGSQSVSKQEVWKKVIYSRMRTVMVLTEKQKRERERERERERNTCRFVEKGERVTNQEPRRNTEVPSKDMLIMLYIDVQAQQLR